MNNKEIDFRLKKKTKQIPGSDAFIGLVIPLRRKIQRKTRTKMSPERAMAGRSSQMQKSLLPLPPPQINAYIIKFLNN